MQMPVCCHSKAIEKEFMKLFSPITQRKSEQQWCSNMEKMYSPLVSVTPLYHGGAVYKLHVE